MRSDIPFMAMLGALAFEAGAVTPAIVMRQSGPHTNRVEVVYAAEAFLASEMQTFVTAANRAMMYRDTSRLGEPYRRYQNFFNFYRIELISQVSGITSSVQNTPLQGRHDNDRLGTVNSTRLRDSVVAGLNAIGVTNDGWNHAILNSSGYYNSGGSNTCVFSYNYYGEIALHEGGHAFQNLADEYGGTGTSFRCNSNVNMAATTAEANTKWGHWMGYRQSGFRGTSTVTIGTVQGGCYMDAGSYRPTPNSKMNLVPDPFNVVSIERIIQTIYAVVNPVDSYTPGNTGTVTDPDSLFVRVVDPAVIWVDWYVDNQLVRSNGGQVFRMAGSGISLGAHAIRAHTYDEVVIRANSNNASPNALDWARLPAVLADMQQDVTWNVNITRPPTPILAWDLQSRPSLRREPRGFSFELPGATAYSLRIFTMDGRVISEFKGHGTEGRNFIALPDGGMGNVMTKFEVGGR